MGRPTIRDVAATADVSVSTVNRVLGKTGKVRQATMHRVLEAAQEIGFYGVGAIQHRVAATRHRYRLGILMQAPNQLFYDTVSHSLRAAAAAFEDGDVRLRIEYLDDLSPERVASRMLELGVESDSLAVVAAEHPIVTAAIDKLADQAIPVVAMVSPLSSRSNVGYVGPDGWKIGRTSAWAFDHICKTPGKIGILVGTHRYRCHDLNESGFRSYFREYANEFILLEALSTFESNAIAREVTEKLLRDHSDLTGLYVSGGGIPGVLAALKDGGKAGDIVTLGYDLNDATKAGLLDGTLTLVISHRFEELARETISAMIRAKESGPEAGSRSVLVPFDIYTRENI